MNIPCRHQRDAGAADVFDQYVPDRDGGFDPQGVDFLHRVESPRGQVLPVTLMTLPSSSSTFSGQPIGQTIQVYSFTSLAMPLTFFPR